MIFVHNPEVITFVPHTIGMIASSITIVVGGIYKYFRILKRNDIKEYNSSEMIVENNDPVKIKIDELKYSIQELRQ